MKIVIRITEDEDLVMEAFRKTKNYINKPDEQVWTDILKMGLAKYMEMINWENWQKIRKE